MAVESVLSGRGGEEIPGPPHSPHLRRDLRRKRGRIGPPRGRRAQRLAHLAVGEVRGGEAAGTAAVVDEAVARDGHDVLGRAEPQVRRVVPQHAPPAAAHDHRNDDLAVVLPEIEVSAAQVEEPVLVLAEPVEPLVRARLEGLAHLVRRLTLERDATERLAAARGLAQQRPAVGVFEGNLARSEAHPAAQPGRRQHDRAFIGAHVEARRHASRHHRQAWPRRLGRAVGPGLHPHDPVGAGPEPDMNSGRVHRDAIGQSLPLRAGIGGRTEHHRRRHHERTLHRRPFYRLSTVDRWPLAVDGRVTLRP